MLYDGKRGSNHHLQQKCRILRRGCTLGEPGRKPHEPNHRKLITADKMAAATKSGAGESSARTGRS